MSPAHRRARLAAGGAAVAVAAVGVGVTAPAAAASARTTVNVVHGIPGATVRVCVDGASVVDRFAFGASVVGAQLPAGTHRVALVAAGAACTSPPVLQATYRLKPDLTYTVVANLDAAGRANLKAFGDNVAPTTSGKARLTVRHTAQAPAVNVWAGGARLVGGSAFTWGHSANVGVPAGTYAAAVSLPGSTQPVIGPASLRLQQGVAYTVYAVGSPGTYRLVPVAVPVGVR